MGAGNIFVTGGAGYIGSHVCKALAQKGFTPVTYDNLCSGNAEAVKWGPFEKGDIRDRARLAAALKQYKPVAIMHFAALIQVGISVTNPAEFYDNNLFGSYCLLEEARVAGVEKIVFSSTAAVYGLPEVNLISESHSKNPINPYGHTKLAMENMIRDYAAAYPLTYAILRYFNAAGADAEGEVGPAHQSETHLISLLMRVASDLMPEINVFGTDYATPDGTAVRDYIHVTDLADAHVRALDYILGGKESLTLNLGTSQGRSVTETLEAVRRITGHAVPAKDSPRRAGDPPILLADATLAQSKLGWKPVHSSLDSIVSSAWGWRQKMNKFGKTGAFGGQDNSPSDNRRTA